MLVSQLLYGSQVSHKAIHVGYQAALVAHHCVNTASYIVSVRLNFNESKSAS